MKKLFTILVSCLLIASVFAESPEKLSYQAVIRDANNNLVTEETIGMQISILQGTAMGTPVYVETQTTTTNANGLVSIEIGAGTVQSGDFTSIDWANGPYFIKTETAIEAPLTSYTITGTSQLLSVPYAIYAKKAGSVDITGNEPVFNEWDKNSNNDVNITDNQDIYGEKTFKVNIKANGIGLPYTFGPDTNYVGSEGAFIGFGHYGESEDFIGYKTNRFYFKDSPGGGDDIDPDVIVGGKIGIGVEAPAEKLEVDGNVDMHNNTIKNVANPVNAQDAATMAYVDAKPGVPSGTQTGEVLYWDGSAWVTVAPGTSGQVLTFVDGVPTWLCKGAPSVTTDPASPVGATTATLKGTVNANGFSTTVTFEYGTSTSYGSTVTATPGTVTGSSNISESANISGLTLGQTYHYRIKAVNCGGIAVGNDLTVLTTTTVPGAPTIGTATAGNAQTTVTFTAPVSNGGSPITGYTVTSSPGGISRTGASSPITVTGLTNLTAYTFTVVATNIIGSGASSAPSNSVILGTVTSPATGKIWMDRNLGATRVAISSTDADAYGYLYQWGRGSEGHQVRTSSTTTKLSSSNTPGHGNFIIAPNIPYDWRSPQNNNLWQGVSGVNNPCPSGYRLPIEAEWDAERSSWSTNNTAGAFASPLKLPVAGYRNCFDGSLYSVGSFGHYWSSTVSGTDSRGLLFGSRSDAGMNASRRATGTSVRCLKD